LFTPQKRKREIVILEDDEDDDNEDDEPEIKPKHNVLFKKEDEDNNNDNDEDNNNNDNADDHDTWGMEPQSPWSQHEDHVEQNHVIVPNIVGPIVVPNLYTLQGVGLFFNFVIYMYLFL
jgi:hypothetical protein